MFSITGSLLCGFLILLLFYAKQVYSAYHFFKNLNIPGPSPIFFFGNFLDVVRTRRLSLLINKWSQTYGRVFGYFEGHTPILVINDPDVLQDVFISSFSNFHSRRVFALDDPHGRDVHLFSAMGLRWKRQRFVINPTFSSTKLKQMMPLIHRTLDSLLGKIVEISKNNEPFDIYSYYKRFTMDSIWSCAFGLETDMQNNTDDPYLINSQRVFQEELRLDLIVSMLFDEFHTFWVKLYHFTSDVRYRLRNNFPILRKFIQDDANRWIMKETKRLIEKRIQLGDTSRVDLLQLMLNSVIEDDIIEDRPAVLNDDDLKGAEVPLIRKLTKHEVAANVFLFMLAGYETTSTALAYLTYTLATYPEEQIKLQHHIDAFFRPSAEVPYPTYDVINQMDYLDMFIRETLRMYPIVPIVINRQASEAFFIKDVGTVPAGTRIAVDIYNLHFDPELWGPVDPHDFYPERFATKRHPMAWIPFGAGPRNCVGMRFALMEMKMALISLVCRYNIISCGPQTQKSFDDLRETFVIAPNDVIIRLEHRLDF